VPPRSIVAAEPLWVPQTFSVRKPRRGQTTDRRTGAHRPYWELRWFVDGTELRQRFQRAADANEFALVLQDGFRAGWAYDGAARQFVNPTLAREPAPPDEPELATASGSGMAPTVLEWTETYWAEKWSSLEPNTRSDLSRYLNRARRHFVDTAPRGDEADAVDAYLRKASLSVREPFRTDITQVGEDWLRHHSLPLAGVGRDQIEQFLTENRVNKRYADRQVSPATERRMVADLKQCWARAVERDLLASSPWDKVRLRNRAPSGVRLRTGKDALVADADLVLSPEQVFHLADACVTEGSWDGSVACFVLVMGLCGLRPSEAVGLILGDVDVTGEGPGWITVRRSHRRIPARYLEDEEDPEWGPLKGRDLADTRRVPVPTKVAARLCDHLATFCKGAATHELVFNRQGRPYSLDVFGGEVWAPARRSLFPPVATLDPASPLQPKLSRIRRHDLRHSACSLWLRSGVDVTVCQRWSGHKRLSVFLDIYQGLIPGREEAGIALLETALKEIT